MILAITSIATLSVAALYVWEMHQTKLRHQEDPIRSGRDPEFARLPENDWYERVLTSTEWAR